MHAYRSKKSGFTLVEILIVVIILGILAAIVIPQFTNASTEARENSARSLVQTIRSQLELYKMQHGDLYPTDTGAANGTWDWDKLTGQTDGNGNAGTDYGPYLQQTPGNPLRAGASGVQSVANDAAALAAEAGATDGFVFSRATGKIWAFAAGDNATVLDAPTTTPVDDD